MMNSQYGIRAEQTKTGFVVHGYECALGCASSVSYLAVCPVCSGEVLSAVFSGVGKVWSFTTFRIPNGEFPADRTVLYVDLEAGPRVLCEAEGAPNIGEDVRVTGLSVLGTPVVSAA